MRWRPLMWLGLSVLFFVGAAYFWHLGNEWAAEKGKGPKPATQPTNSPTNHASVTKAPKLTGQSPAATTQSASSAGVLAAAGVQPVSNSRFAYRLNNSKKTLGELTRDDKAILLENALIETGGSKELGIPSHLKSNGDPGTYIVQSKGPLDDNFRAMLGKAGGTIVSYIPNNAYLVRASASVADGLSGEAQVQAVLPYEPYYKLKSSLLKLAIQQQPLPADGSMLNLLLFPDGQDATLKALDDLKVEVVGKERSPFGTELKVRAPKDGWVAVARLPGVEVMEMARPRARANDLSRVRLGVAIDSQTTENYLGLTGQGVLVNVNDTGVDATHPDLGPRVIGDQAGSLTDTDGHGTHVAGIIASSGGQSSTVTNASGSIMPGVTGQFRGIAPEARLFSMSTDLTFGPGSDMYLQETAARTNALISNNSWHYFNDTEYDLAAASYDAAVRDALPGMTGSQPLIYVFSAGNDGGGDDTGTGGSADTIGSPGTAKNVITVGAIEQFRNITNETYICRDVNTGTNVMNICFTNKPWNAMTDGSNQVASFSSRGNVGVGVEGDFGRFKPDLVAPGTFVVSTKSQQWDQQAYYNPTNFHFDFIQDQFVDTNNLEPYAIFVPGNAVGLTISVFASEDLRIYVRQAGVPTTTTYDVLGTNTVTIGGGALAPRDTFWNYAIGSINKDKIVPFDILTELVTTNDLGNYLQVLSNMNNSLGPYYRYESGTSMASPQIAGMLALMHEYFQSVASPGVTNSPALMKALLINGARPTSEQYDLQVRNSINYQGWGLANLQTTIPTNAFGSTTGSKLFFDQSPANALATGQSRTFSVTVKPEASGSPLRVTLAWTDPPGNPVASTKLVNDLDLIVTNRDTGEVFVGNDILGGSDFNLPWDTNTIPNLDVVNNVENVYLLPPMGGTYDITVVGRRVNVNAVTAHPNDVVQDFALVISSGDGEVSNALTLTQPPPPTPAPGVLPVVTFFTNNFSDDPENFGGMLLGQHVGASAPLLGTNALGWPPVNGQITLGTTNGWHFYVLTNTTDFTNAAFLTFLPPTLSDPVVGVHEASQDNATRSEADIDLYVTTDANLTNLDAAAISGAQKSISRGGTETVVLSNAVPGTYYVGVKSEDQEGAEFGFLGVFSLNPFANQDQNGNLLLRGFPRFVSIPDGTPEHPGGTRMFAVAPQPITVRRAIVTNNITHELVSDLFGRMDHGRDFVVLNNHSGQGGVTNVSFIYNDSNQHDIPNALHTDGPGNLGNFSGKQGAGQWMLTMVDNAPGHVGTNNLFTVWLEKQKDLLDGVTITLANGDCSEDFIFVPPEATNLTILGTITAIAGGGPVTMQVCPEGGSGNDCQQVSLTGPGVTNTIVLNKSSNPPLNAGNYVVRVCNNSGGDVTVVLQARLEFDLAGIVPTQFKSAAPIAILDDAVTNSSIFVTNDDKIASIEVGVRIDHPRVSDLVLHLISPDGTRLLLQENRGASTPNGMGTSTLFTNITPVSSSGDWHAQTNVIDTGQTSGTISINWNFFDVADWMRVYYDGNLIMDTGVYRGVGSTNLAYGPGNATTISIVMNEGDNTNGINATAWNYTVGSSIANYVYATFTENTNETITPIKFAIPPFTIPNYIGTNTALTNQIFYQPEDAFGLDRFTDTSSFGDWRLEVWDNRVGATNPAPVLLGWQLSFVFASPKSLPVPLQHHTPATNTIPVGGIVYFTVPVPYWASFATNILLSADQPVNVMFNQFTPPTGINIGPGGDTLLMQPPNAAPQIVTLDTNGVAPLPLLLPGLTYYVGISNAGAAQATISYEVDFNVTPLTNGIPVSSPSDSIPRYFSYDVTPDETGVSFALTNLSGNVNLVARKGLPFPAPTNFALGSFNPSTNDEDIIVLTNSEGIVLSPGRWYLGVFNADVTTVNYTIVVTDMTNALPPIITLFNRIPYANTNSGVGISNDYYRFVVSTNALRAQFEINNPSADMTLVARKGLPLPDLSSFDLISANPGTTDELIVLYDFSSPIRLTPGDWFLTAVNVSGGPATYSIMASEWSLYGTNIVITNSGISGGNSFCITWTSLPGVHYYVQGRMNLGDPNWDVVSPTITATDYSTTWCIALPSPYHFFRVHEGLSALAAPIVAPPAITGISRNGSGILIQWSGTATNQFRVQWANSVVPPVTWNTISTVVTSANGNFSFLDDGSQTGGLGGQRFYRLQQLP